MEQIVNPKLSKIYSNLESAVEKLHEFTRVIEHKGSMLAKKKSPKWRLCQ